jgi:hypothetical protein
MSGKIVVPEEMLKAADQAIGEVRLRNADALRRNGELWPNDLKRVCIEAALLWLSENPIVPTDRYYSDFMRIPRHPMMTEAQQFAVEWQRRMFIAPKPEVLEFMECETCSAKPGSPTLCAGCLHNRSLIEKLTDKMTSGRTKSYDSEEIKRFIDGSMAMPSFIESSRRGKNASK